MQAQHELLFTLQDILTAIICGADRTGAADWDALVEAGLHPAGQAEAWNPHTHEAFSPPIDFSPENLNRKAHDRLAMIRDELFLLETEPAYMQEVIKFKRVAISNISSDLRREDQLAHAGSLFMMELVGRYSMWQTISSATDALAQAFRSSESLCGPGMWLPRTVSEHMDTLSLLLQEWYRQSGQNFENIVHSTNALKHRYRMHAAEGQVYVEEVADLNPYEPADRLRWRINVTRKRSVDVGSLLSTLR